MISTTFYISDLHLGHANTTNGKFKNKDGTNLRPFADIEEMNDEIIQRWNAVVQDHDKVYVLGDVVINQKFLPLVKELKGKKRLIRGNHDIFRTRDYMDVGFKEIYGVRVLKDCILSHIPLHPDSITKRFGINVHGHLHGNVVTMSTPDGDIPDPRYVNVAVEQIDYTPISHDELMTRARDYYRVVGWDFPHDTRGNE